MIGFGCTVPNPDFSESNLAGEAPSVTISEQLAGEQLAGEQFAGEQLAGEQLAGEQLAGEQLAGEQLAGEQLAGTQTIVDMDEDGVLASDDCNDADATVFPGQNEQCNGKDDDCDGQVDEALDEPCFVRIQVINAPNDVSNLGDQITLAGDLDEDGVEDILVRGQRNGRRRLIAISSRGSILWAVNGDGDFASAVTSGQFLGGEDHQVIASDPENDRAIIYNTEGMTLSTIPINDGRISSLLTLQTTDVDLLVLGMPERYVNGPNRANGRITVLKFLSENRLSEPEVVYIQNGFNAQEWGARMFKIGDFDNDSVEDFIFTRVINFENRTDIGTQLMSGATGMTSRESLYFTFDDTYYSFATSFTYGRFAPNGGPLVSESALEQGALYSLLSSPDGLDDAEPGYGLRANDTLGRSLATLPRPDQDTDLLLIGGRRSIVYQDPSTQEVTLLVSSDDNLEVGLGLAVSQRRLADGSYRVWVGGRSEALGESEIWIYSAR